MQGCKQKKTAFPHSLGKLFPQHSYRKTLIKEDHRLIIFVKLMLCNILNETINAIRVIAFIAIGHINTVIELLLFDFVIVKRFKYHSFNIAQEERINHQSNINAINRETCKDRFIIK